MNIAPVFIQAVWRKHELRVVLQRKGGQRESERNGVRDTRNEGICIKLVIFSSATVRWWRIQSYHRDCKKVCTGDLLTSKGYSKHSFFLLYRSKRVAEDLRSKH